MAYQPPLEGKIIAADLLVKAYPVGAIYMSTVNTSPASFLGGTWTQIQDCMLLAAGSTYTAGNTGGAATQTISTSNIPTHTHNFAVTTSTNSADHTHTWSDTSGNGGSHTHSIGYDNDGTGSSSDYAPRDYVGASLNAPGDSQGNHSHTASGTTATDSADHTHTVSMSSGSTGSGSSFSILPPYLAVYVWKRTA